MILHNIEQNTHEWHLMRLGKVTGTRLKAALGKDNLSLIDELIAERVSGQYEENYVTDKMQRGKDLEPVARLLYSDMTEQEVMEYGFIQSSIHEHLGLSPDGLVYGYGAIEIKCPDTKKHVQYIRQAQIPNEHKHQVLANFIVDTELIWLDFISYDPRFTIKPMFVHRVHREELATEIEQANIELDKFFAKYDKIYQSLIF